MSRHRSSDMIDLADTRGVNATGIECLAVAIFDQTARDLRRLRREGKNMLEHNGSIISIAEIEAFFESAWCEDLLVNTSYTPEDIRARI